MNEEDSRILQGVRHSLYVIGQHSPAPAEEGMKHPGFDARLVRVTGVLPDLFVSVVRGWQRLC